MTCETGQTSHHTETTAQSGLYPECSGNQLKGLKQENNTAESKRGRRKPLQSLRRGTTVARSDLSLHTQGRAKGPGGLQGPSLWVPRISASSSTRLPFAHSAAAHAVS